MYKASILFESAPSSYEHGEDTEISNNWEDSAEFKTKDELKKWICEQCYTDWDLINHDDANEYDWASEYWAGYMTDEQNMGEASKTQLEQWEAGKLALWAVHCHILVSEVTKTKAVL